MDGKPRTGVLRNLERNARLTDEMTALAPFIVEKTIECQTTLDQVKQISVGTAENIAAGDRIINELLNALSGMRRMKSELRALIKSERHAKYQTLEQTVTTQRAQMRRLVEEHDAIDNDITLVDAELQLMERNIHVYDPPSVIEGFCERVEKEEKNDDVALTLASSQAFFAAFAGLKQSSMPALLFKEPQPINPTRIMVTQGTRESSKPRISLGDYLGKQSDVKLPKLK